MSTVVVQRAAWASGAEVYFEGDGAALVASSPRFWWGAR